LINNSEDHELAKIQRKKMDELLLRIQTQEKPNENLYSKPILLTDTNFTSEVTKAKLIVVDFWAPWCGPCKMVGPLIEELATEYAGKVVFGKMNVDENQMVPRSFGIQGIPTLMIFKNGKAIDTLVGAYPKSQIESKFRPHIE
jgi:thioredoxin 1